MDKEKQGKESAVEIYKDLPQRTGYAAGVTSLIDALSLSAKERRDDSLRSGKAAFEKNLTKMLGWPLSARLKKNKITVRTEPLVENGLFRAVRYGLEVMPGFWFHGVLYKPAAVRGKNAFVIAQHGGGGTPELVGGLMLDSANYNHMAERLLEKGVTVFAPQLLLWNTELFGSGYDREKLNRRLLQLGGSITALEVWCIRRCIDYFSGQSFVDKDRIGMIGLSYGGMYTVFTAALDKRIKAAYSSCWFNDRAEYNWHDWTYFNQENLLFDAETAALILPRELFIEVGEKDTVFSVDSAREEIARLENIAGYYGEGSHLHVNVFSGVHELDPDNTFLEEFIAAVSG